MAATLTAQEPTFPARSVGVTAMALRQLFADYWRWHLAAQPEDATRAGVHVFDDRWRDWSAEGRAAARERRQEFQRNFQYAGLGNLTTRERLNLALVERRLAAELAPEPLQWLSRLSPGGAHEEVFRVVGWMPARDVADYERLLSRLRAIPAYVEQHVELWNELLAGGFAQPGSVVDAVVAEVEREGAVSADQSPLLEAFRHFPASIPPAEQARLDRFARAAYVEGVAPAWARLGRFLRDTYRPRARTTLGVNGLPAGSAHYLARLAYYGVPTDAVAPLYDLAAADAARLRQRAGSVLARAPAGQTAVAATTSSIPVPEFRQHLRLPAFDEGWNVFDAFRRSAAEADLSGDRAAQQAARLAHEAAVRAAVDAGIHVTAWSRAEAVAFAVNHVDPADANRLVDEIAATPGRALAVYAGARRFAEIRRATEARLGERFDARVFEQAVLGDGPLTLDLVEIQLDEAYARLSARRP